MSSSLTPSNERYAVEDIEAFSPFSDLVTDRILTKAYRFPSFSSGYLHSSHWLRMHFFRTKMKSLYSYRNRLSTNQSAQEQDTNLQVSDDELQGYILSLCRCIPFSISPENGTIGHICRFFPLVAAAKHFTEHGHLDLLNWVHNVRNCIFNKGLSMPIIEGADIPPLDTVKMALFQDTSVR